MPQPCSRRTSRYLPHQHDPSVSPPCTMKWILSTAVFSCRPRLQHGSLDLKSNNSSPIVESSSLSGGRRSKSIHRLAKNIGKQSTHRYGRNSICSPPLLNRI